MPGLSAPVLIERSLLVDGNDPVPARVEDIVAFQRRGPRVLLVAPKPKSWRPTRRSVDRDLALQQSVHQMVSRAGAELDGVLYMGTGLFSRRQAQKNEFNQIARRYGRDVSEVTLVGTQPDLLEAGVTAGVRVLAVGGSNVGNTGTFESLEAALASLDP